MKENLTKYIAAAIFAALSILLYGYNYGLDPNQIQILPFIYKIANHELFPNDYYVNTLGNFPSFFPYIMAFLSKWFNLEIMHFIFYIIFKYLLLIAGYNLAYFLFKSHRTAIIPMFLFGLSPLMNVYSLLGHDPLIKTSFYQTSAVVPISIIAILTFLQKRYKITAVILVFIYYINGLIGNFLFIMFSLASFRIWLHKADPDDIKAIKNSLIIFIMLMLPGVFWLFKTTATHPYPTSKDFIIWLKNWYPGHYFLLYRLTSSQWWRFFTVFLLYFIIFFKRGLKTHTSKNEIKSFLYAFFIMWTVAFIFADIFPIRRIMLLQLFRSDVFFISLGCIFAADYAREIIERKTLKDIAIVALIFFVFLEFCKPFYAWRIFFLLALFEYKDSLVQSLKKVSFEPKGFIEVLQRLCLYLFIFVSISDLLVYENTAKIMCFMLLLVLLLSDLEGHRYSILIRFALPAVFIISILPYFSTMQYRAVNKNLSDSLRFNVEEDWVDVQLWAKSNSPQDSIFIAPIYMYGFRVFSKRSVFVDYVDGAAIHWQSGFEKEWTNRLSKLNCNMFYMKEIPDISEDLTTGSRTALARLFYMELDENVFRSINREYMARYVIEEGCRPLNFPLVYKNKTFSVYRIE